MRTWLESSTSRKEHTRLRLTEGSKAYLKLNLLLTLLALAAVSRPRAGSTSPRGVALIDQHVPSQIGPKVSAYAPINSGMSGLKKIKFKEELSIKLVTSDGTPLSSTEAPSLDAAVESWAASNGVPDFQELCEKLTVFNDEETTLLCVTGCDEPSNFSDVSSKTALLKLIATTTFGQQARLPETKAAWKEALEDLPTVLDWFGELRRISARITVLLMKAATPPGSCTTAFPEIFESLVSLARIDGKLHAISGFQQFHLIRTAINRDPQGTSIVRQNECVAKLDEACKDNKFGLYAMHKLLIAVFSQVAIGRQVRHNAGLLLLALVTLWIRSGQARVWQRAAIHQQRCSRTQRGSHGDHGYHAAQDCETRPVVARILLPYHEHAFNACSSSAGGDPPPQDGGTRL